MRKILLLIVITFIANYTFPQNDWIEQTNGIDVSFLLYSPIDASDSLNAVIGGWYNKIFITTNSGNNWSMLEYGTVDSSQFEYAADISIIDKEHIWVGNSLGKIFSTSDGGTTWQLQFYDTTITNFINYIEMFDLQNGVAMGDKVTDNDTVTAILLITTDGGQNWITKNINLGGYILDWWRRIDFINIDTGYIFKSYSFPYRLYKTTDGGNSWWITNYSYYSSYLTILKFYNEDIGFAESYGKIYYTLDGGFHWDSSFVNNNSWGMDIEFISNGNSFIVALAKDKNIYFSSDTGKTWISQSTPGIYSPFDICFPDIQHGWLLMSGGVGVKQVYYKGNGLITNIDYENIIPNNYSVSQNYPNPFNPSTTIEYSLPFESNVSIVVYNILGEEIAKLVDGNMQAGLHKFNFNGTGLSSGIYFYSVRAISTVNKENFSKVKKMVLLK